MEFFIITTNETFDKIMPKNDENRVYLKSLLFDMNDNDPLNDNVICDNMIFHSFDSAFKYLTDNKYEQNKFVIVQLLMTDESVVDCLCALRSGKNKWPSSVTCQNIIDFYMA